MFGSNIMVTLFNTIVVMFRIAMKVKFSNRQDPDKTYEYAGMVLDNFILFFGLTQEVIAVLTSIFLFGVISSCRNSKLRFD